VEEPVFVEDPVFDGGGVAVAVVVFG